MAPTNSRELVKYRPTKKEILEIEQEAAQRYTDTSWRIFRQSKRKDGDFLPISNNNNIEKPQTNPKNDEVDKTADNKTTTPNTHTSNESLATKTNKDTDVDDISSIQTFPSECQYEPVNRTVEVVLHSHEDQTKNGHDINKIITSSSYNGFGETHTTQPRSSRSVTNGIPSNMDLSYVTERIIAIWFPTSCTTDSYRQGQRQAAHMLRNKHGNKYMVFNLTEPKRILKSEHKRVKEVGWPRDLAPALESLCSICKEIDSWLQEDQHRIAVLHARGNKDKLGVVVASYMHYSSICGNAEQALDRFSMRRFLEDSIGPLKLPSNKRYVDYFSGLLSHNIKINTDPLYLTHVTVLGAPSFEQGGCRAFLKLYQGKSPIYTSGVYAVSSGISQFTVNLAGERAGRTGLPLRGDIMIKCYHRKNEGRETIFACQFHTCAIAENTLSFTRQELDFASKDSRFPSDGAVELHFSPVPEIRHPTPAPTPAVTFTLTDDPVVRADSPIMFDESDEDEDSDLEDVNHTFGPLDGSIYATIAKKPELSPGAVSSPLTVSMDSGISSAGHQQNANTNASASPPLTAQPSPLTPEEQHRELDELLNDMMMTVENIPDLKTQDSPSSNFNLDQVRYIDEEEVPYHARQDSRPFSYGINSNTMITESKGLSSPSLVRKASVNKSSGNNIHKVQTQVYPEYSSNKAIPDFTSHNTYSSPKPTYGVKSNPYQSVTLSPVARRKDPIDDIFTDSALSKVHPIKREFHEEFYKDERKRYDPMKRSLTEGTIRRSPEKLASSPYSDSESLSPPGAFRNSTKSPDFHETYATNNNLTWLQRQQLKLKERREMQLREERLPHESRLISELRSVQSRHMRPTASHRLDGYTSDTTAFADDDDDYSIPLHINTTHRNNSASPGGDPTKTYISYKSRAYNNRTERPFMTVKRAHEKFAQSSSPADLLSSNPFGQIIRSPSRGAESTDSGLLSLVEHEQYKHDTGSSLSQHRYNHQGGLYRDDQWHNSTSEVDTSPSHSSSPRPQTPAFPVHARTPGYTNPSTPTVQFDLRSERLPPKSPTTQRKDRPTSPTDYLNGSASEYIHDISHRSVSATPTSGYRDGETHNQSPKSMQNGSTSPVTLYYGTSRRSSVNSNSEPPIEVSQANVKFVRDTSKFWYKPSISREEAINVLRHQKPGTFIVRDSNSFPNAYGLALRVASVPPNLQTKPQGTDELIRHFLIEPTSRGVRLKGCQNEPVFTSLSALIYQHSVKPMALPCLLVLPEHDLLHTEIVGSPQQQLLNQGAACNVLYILSIDMESLTGPQAIRKAVLSAIKRSPVPETVVVHFKVNGQGITLTDNKRKLFFRKHYPINTISHAGLDPDEKMWSVTNEDTKVKTTKRIFGFVARKPNVNNPDNQCHLFAELEPEQPATAIVNFVNKILTTSGIKPNMV